MAPKDTGNGTPATEVTRNRLSLTGSSNASKVDTMEDTVNILIVDDRPDKLLSLETVLARDGLRIVKASSGREALRCLLLEEFAVILLDVNMPGMDGFETASLIRQRKSCEHTPIIFVTAVNDTDTHVSRGYSLGAVDYIMTPVMPDVLRTKVAVVVELFKRTSEVRRRAENLREVEQREFHRKLAESSDRLETETRRNRFFTLSLDLLAISDFDGTFRQLNPSWENVLGYAEKDLKQKPFLEFVHPEDRTKVADQFEQLKKGVPAPYMENRFTARDGSERWIRWTAAPYPEDQLVYFSGHDITAQRESEKHIRTLNEQLGRQVIDLNEANQNLEAFTYSVAHDLRAPLRAMSGFATALVEDYSEVLDADGRTYAERIESSAQRMDDLIHDLLAYSRVSRDDLQPEDVSLETALNDALGEWEEEIARTHASVDVIKPLPHVKAHRTTLVQILINLVSNGLKFTDSNVEPRLRILTETRDGAVRLWVEDNGIGIDAEHQKRIFGLFQRLHGGNTFPGTGIGLAIVRKGIERMEGRVGVESTPGNGSRFWIELPAV